MNNITIKKCCRCHKQLPLVSFARDASKRNGLMYCCKICDSKLHCARYAKNPKHAQAIAYTSKRKLRQKVLGHYGGKCTCCGEASQEFLAIDHTNGDGSQHRREIGIGGYRIYYWLKKNDFPENFRILCHNCNQAYGIYGYCPHNLNK